MAKKKAFTPILKSASIVFCPGRFSLSLQKGLESRVLIGGILGNPKTFLNDNEEIVF